MAHPARYATVLVLRNRVVLILFSRERCSLGCILLFLFCHLHAASFDSSGVLVKPISAEARKQLSDFDHRLRSLQLVSSSLGLYKLQVLPGETVPNLVYKLLQSGLTEFSEPDYFIRKHASPNDPEFLEDTQWALLNTGQAGGIPGADISAIQAWSVRHDAADIVVAVIDSGVRFTHEDLAPNIWHNPNEIPANNKDDDLNGYIDDVVGVYPAKSSVLPLDEEGHGTHIAGIIGAVGNNGLGVTGVSWKVELMPLRLFDDEGVGRYSDAIKCLDYARQNGASIINASWGDLAYSEALFRAFAEVRHAGLVVVASAGNDGLNLDEEPVYPACFPLDNIIVVSSSDRRDQFDMLSANFGKTTVDLIAPGVEIISTWSSSDASYAFNTGTSMAAPMVTGAMALLKAEYPNETVLELRTRLLRAVDKIPTYENICVTGGRLNLDRALREWIELYTQKTTSGLTISFAQRAGGTYLLESTSDFQTWTLEQRQIATSSGIAEVTLPATEAARFFRVRTE